MGTKSHESRIRKPVRRISAEMAKDRDGDDDWRFGTIGAASPGRKIDPKNPKGLLIERGRAGR
jgi:hypothetical protein